MERGFSLFRTLATGPHDAVSDFRWLSEVLQVRTDCSLQYLSSDRASEPGLEVANRRDCLGLQISSAMDAKASFSDCASRF